MMMSTWMKPFSRPFTFIILSFIDLAFSACPQIDCVMSSNIASDSNFTIGKYSACVP